MMKKLSLTFFTLWLFLHLRAAECPIDFQGNDRAKEALKTLFLASSDEAIEELWIFEEWREFSYKISLDFNYKMVIDKSTEKHSKGSYRKLSVHDSKKQGEIHGSFKFLHLLILSQNVKLLMYILEKTEREVLANEVLKPVQVKNVKIFENVDENDRWIRGANCIHLAAKFVPVGLELILTSLESPMYANVKNANYSLKKEVNTINNADDKLYPLHLAVRNCDPISTRQVKVEVTKIIRQHILESKLSHFISGSC